MEPAERSPAVQRRVTGYSRWERVRHWWRLWASLVPTVIYLLGLLLHVRMNSEMGELVNLACYVYFGVLLAPPLWAILRANPHVFRLRVMRRVLAGAIVSIVAMIGLAITTAISGQSNDAAQLLLVVMTFGGFGLIFLALFIGLLDASKDVIERYQSEHAGESDM